MTRPGRSRTQRQRVFGHMKLTRNAGIISGTPPIADATQIIPICASLERLHDVSAAVQIGGYRTPVCPARRNA